MQLRLHRRDPVSMETTPVTCSISGEKFRLLLRGERLPVLFFQNPAYQLMVLTYPWELILGCVSLFKLVTFAYAALVYCLLGDKLTVMFGKIKFVVGFLLHVLEFDW